MLTQEEYLVLQQRIRHLKIKIELLNQNDAVVDILDGYVISGSINMDADSSYRRSGNIKMAVSNVELSPKVGGRIWFNRKIKIYIGLLNWNDEVIWFNQGIFIIQNAKVNTSNSENTIDIDLTDLMSNLDGTQNGNLTHEVKIVAEGVKVSEALRSTLSKLGKVSIDEITVNDSVALVPYEITTSSDSTVYDLCKTLLDLYVGMEMYFDENGYIIIQKIKDRKQDPILWDFTSEGMNLQIDHSSDFNFANIRNSIYIWGRKNKDGTTTKWNYRNRYSRNTTTEMNNITDKLKGDICHVIEENISYSWNDLLWVKLDFTVPIEFNCESIGEKAFSYTDDKISDESQAKLRAEYELVKRSNLVESFSATSVPVYGFNVNSKIKTHTGEYLVKSVRLGLSHSDTMSFTAEKIYY